MRRAIGLTLAGLGAFLLVIALLTWTYLPGHVIKYPVNEYLKTQLVGHDVAYFSPSLAKPVTGATMTVTSTVKGDGAAGSSSVAVWDTFSYLYDQTNHAVFSYDVRRLAFGRRTAELLMCCGADVGGNPGIRQTGIAGGIAWPIGTQQRTYQIFDPTALRALPARYTGTATIDGITAYRFVETARDLSVGSETLPASLVGMPGTGEVKLPEHYSATNTFFVDPVTGAQLNQIEDQKLTLVDSSGAQRLLLLNASFTFTPQSLQKVVGIDRSARSKVSLITAVLPLVTGLLGLAGLIAGILLAGPRRDGRHRRAETPATQPMLGPAV